MQEYYSIPQAAKICSVNSSTMYRWVTAGKIKSYSTAGGHRRILPRDLKTWMEENQIPFNLSPVDSDKAKILIVDDDAQIRRYLGKVLEGIFIDIDFAIDGFEAGKKIIQFNPNLIILDLYMPNMNGFDVCKMIKADASTQKIKVLILSGQLTEENRKKSFLAGADDVLEKPASKKQLIDSVTALLKKA